MLDMLMQDARCNLFKLLLLSLDAASQSTIFRPLGIKVFKVCVQVNSFFSLIDLDLGMGVIYLPMTGKVP